MASASRELKWHKACGTNACIEVARDERVHVRDSQDPAGPRLVFAPQAWKAFLESVRRGHFK
jgi:hypothetical protein